MSQERTIKIIWICVLALGFMLCIRELREPDLWWQLRTGEWMIENKSITHEDVFSYTYDGVEWINVKWGYEVIIAFLSSFLGPESVMLLNMLSVFIILFFLKKTFYLLHIKEHANKLLSLSLVAILFLILHNTRINGRPEMTTYTLTTVYFYLFTLFRTKKSLWIYALIPLQVFWTNMHEAYGVGVVMIGIFLVGSLIENWLSQKKKIEHNETNLKVLFTVSILSFLGILINPNGANLLNHYIEIYTQLQENKFTTENFSYRTSEYWNYVAIINFLLFVITFPFLLFQGNKKGLKNKVFHAISTYGLVYLLLYLAFFYLSLQASRNTFFFSLIATIPLAQMLHQYVFSNFKTKNLIRLTAAVCILFYLSIGTGTFYESLSPREKYGLKVSSKRTSLGASKFLKDNNIKGKGFVDYLNSSYLLWSLQPDFKTYLDLRDLDIYPQNFMRNVFTAYEYPDIPLENGSILWDAMVQEDSFDFVVMSNNEQFMNFNRFLTYRDSKYELVHADGVTSTYLSTKYANLVDSLGYKNGERDVFESFQDIETKGIAKFITKVFWPFYDESYISDQEERLTRQAYLNMLQ